jgi:hypothetical protein
MTPLFLTLSPEPPNAGVAAVANTVKRHATIAKFFLNIIASPVGSSVSTQAMASPKAANRQKPSGQRRQFGHRLSDEPFLARTKDDWFAFTNSW